MSSESAKEPTSFVSSIARNAKLSQIDLKGANIDIEIDRIELGECVRACESKQVRERERKREAAKKGRKRKWLIKTFL